MRVYALVRINTISTDGGGERFGEIVAIHRADRLNKKALDKHAFHVWIYVPLDLTIPCGNEFEIERWGKCGECPNNDPEECDVQKYCRGLWSKGDVQNPPVLLSKHRYKIIISSALNVQAVSLITKENKTAVDVQNIVVLANTLPNMNVYIEDKADDL